MMDACLKYVEAIEQSGKFYLTEPFFLSILLDQAKKIRAFEKELKVLGEEIKTWKKVNPTSESTTFQSNPFGGQA